MKFVIGCIDTTLSSIAILAHIIGLLSIHLYKKKTTQNIILASLSTTEITTCVFHIVKYWCTHKHSPFSHFINFCKWTSVYEILFMMYILTIDRLLCVLQPLKYTSRITRRRIRRAVYVSCVASIVLGILEHCFRTRYLLIGLGLLYGVFVLITYTLVIVGVESSRRISSPDNAGLRRKVKPKEVFVPGLIILSFVVLNCVPHLVYYFVNSLSEVARKVLEIFMVLGLVVDPFTYVILASHYRKALIQKIHPVKTAAATARERDVFLMHHLHRNGEMVDICTLSSLMGTEKKLAVLSNVKN